MTIFEVVVVVVGLLAGWFGISAAFNRAAARKLRTLASRYSNEDLDNAWPSLLQVDRSAEIDAIDAAWGWRCDELRKCFPTMMTETEGREFEQARAILSRARDIATRQSSGSGQVGGGSG